MPSNSITQNIPAVQLPNIDILPFSGNLTAWVLFFEIFSTLIIKNPNLSNIQCFMYLKGYLRGEPLQLISNLQLTNDNFDIALTTLQKRYTNEILQVNAHIRSLFDKY